MIAILQFSAPYKNASKLAPLLRLRYHDSIPDAVADLGEPDTISAAFTGFQKFLYGPAA